MNVYLLHLMEHKEIFGIVLVDVLADHQKKQRIKFCNTTQKKKKFK